MAQTVQITLHSGQNSGPFSHSSDWAFNESCYIVVTLSLLPMAQVLLLPLKMAEWQIKEIPFGDHGLWKQMLAYFSVYLGHLCRCSE